jgi:GTP-binding protein
MKRKSTFIKSAVFPTDYPPPLRPEIAVVGRSNAGKSSLINAWVGSNIAKVSQTPGKTRLLNFFEIGEKYRLVDLPGYGWAAREVGELEQWQQMIEGYLQSRECLKAVLLLMDIRRDWSKDEIMLKEFVETHSVPVVLVLTKADKVSRNEASKLSKKLHSAAALTDCFVVSSQENVGVDELEEKVFNKFVKVK